MADNAQQLYPRDYSILLGSFGGPGTDFKDFKCTFRIRRGDLQTPNSCDLRVYNLADSTAASLMHPEFSSMVIKAGYVGNSNVIFQGTVKQIRVGRVDQRDTYVDI